MRRLAPLLLFTAACADQGRPPLPGEIRIAEVATKNSGGGPTAGRDELGEYDDWIELENLTDDRLNLAGLFVSDMAGSPRRHQIPQAEPVTLEKRGRILLFADAEVHQGPQHLAFRLSSSGEDVSITSAEGETIDAVAVPELGVGRSFAWLDGAYVDCASPTPGLPNRCETAPPRRKTYAPYAWPEIWPPAPAGPVVMRRIDPEADRVELENRGEAAVDLSTLSFRVPLSGSLAAGARLEVDVPLEASDRIALGDMHQAQFDEIAPGQILTLPDGGGGLHQLDPVMRPTRPMWLSALRSPEDFEALATHPKERTADARSIKFVIDRQDDDRVYLIDSERFSLHFDFVWEALQDKQPFNRCDPGENAQHLQEWQAFSLLNYFTVEARQYYLGTLLYYPDSGLYTVEFVAGDRITPEMIEEAFFLIAARIADGSEYAWRPSTARQEVSALAIEGRLPIVPVDAPFEGQTFQALNPGVAYGLLEFVSTKDLEEAPVSFQTIAILDELPNDVPPIGGTITEAFQTPLAHVNVLAQNRKTPNMALANARNDPRIEPYLGTLVRFEVSGEGFEIRAATSTEAEAFWEERRQQTGVFVPEKDLSVQEIVDLQDASFADIPRIGAKASQFAELINLDWPRAAGGFSGPCALTQLTKNLPVPRPGFAIPFARYQAHLETNGIDTELSAFLADDAALADPVQRKARLAEIRRRIETAPVDPAFLAELEQLVADRFGTARVRFRSSTNVEDLAGFNGAGLYRSASAQAGSSARPIERAVRRVWASTWSFRAFEERSLFGVDQTQVQMGVLMHAGFPAEEANGVAITKNVVNPASHGFYINAQVGEISVVNPEGGALPEQLLYKTFSPPEVVVLARSSVLGGEPVLREGELHRLSCALRAVHNHFLNHYREEIDPARFAVDVEFKIDGPNRDVVLKQARPWIEHRPPETTCE